jgi:hypothetical protein
VSRLLAEPVKLDVDIIDGVPDVVGLPPWGRHPVTRVSARWRVQTDWWRTAVAREYWKLTLQRSPATRGGEELLCEIYHDQLSGEWYLTRIYD